MKRNTIIKILLDAAMLVLYLLLMFARDLGGFFHETVGLGICILFVMHFLLNLSMTKGLLNSATKSGAKANKIILLMMDIVLLIGMPLVIVSGVLMAKDLFVVDTGLPWELIFNLHNVLSYVCLGAMLLHLVLHAKYLIAVCKKLPSALGSKEMKSALCRFGAGTACGKHCSLLTPRCGRGQMQAQQAEEEYNQTYYSA